MVWSEAELDLILGVVNALDFGIRPGVMNVWDCQLFGAGVALGVVNGVAFVCNGASPRQRNWLWMAVLVDVSNVNVRTSQC